MCFLSDPLPLIASICIVIVLFSLCVSSKANTKEKFIITNDNLYDLIELPDMFDTVSHSITTDMTFRERNSKDFQKLFDSGHHEIQVPWTKKAAEAIIQEQICDEYKIMFWQEHPTYYDIVIQAPYKMYGVAVVLPKMKQWKPKVVGYVLDDKINMVSGTMGRLSDYYHPVNLKDE